MQEKRKKFWLIFIVSILSVVSICAIFVMITSLKTVTVEMRQQLGQYSKLDASVLEKVKNDGEFEYGKGLLFVDAQKSIDKIEKENPFVKVEQVIREFPNKLTVYISEREPCFYASYSGYYVVMDKEFKVLDKVEIEDDGLDYLKQNYPNLTCYINYSFIDNSLAIGDFVKVHESMELYKQIYQGVVGAYESFGGLIKDISIKNSNVDITINNSQETIIKIEGLDDLKIKSFTAIEFFNKIDETKSVKTIKVKQIKEHVYSAIIDE